MPPKSSEGKSSSEASKMKSKSQTAFADQRLDEISVSRARIIASKLGIANPGKHVRVVLIPLIREKTALVTECVECGGGSSALVDHVFPASDSGTTRGFASGNDDSDTPSDSPTREHLHPLDTNLFA